MLLTVAIPSLMAVEKSYTIMLDKSTKSSTTTLTTSNFVETLVSSGDEYIKSVINVTKVYPEVGYAKLGAKGSAGIFWLAINPGYQVVPTRIVLNAKKYGSDTGKLNILLNGETKAFGSDQTPTDDFSDLEFSDASFEATVQSIKVSTTAARAYVKSITIYYEEDESALGTPVVDVTGGTYDVEKTVTITAADGAEVRYTTNDESDIKNGVAGTDYTVGNTLTIDKSCTLRVIAVKGEEFSNVLSETYVMKTAKPVITVNDDTNLVTITTGYAENVKVYYTLDGTTPVKGVSEEYTVPFVVDKETTINAIAVYGSFDESDVASVYYGDFVLYDFTDATIWGYTQPAEKKNVQIDGLTLSIDETKPTISNTSGGGTKVRFYGISATQSVLRVYSNNTLTFKAPEGEDIYQIVFTYNDASKVFGPSTTCTTGNYDKNTGIWTGAANEVTFNISCSNNNADIKWLQIMTTKVANSVVDINKKGALYTLNFELNGQAANGGVLYARTTDTSVEASKPDKNFFDKSYEDYDWESKDVQRDWVAINGNTELAGKTLATGFIARYDGVKLTPVAAIADNGDAASYTLNTFGVANVFYGNYENTETLGMKNDYRPFFVKAKVNEVANYVGEVKEVTGGLELWGSGVCGKLNNKGLKIDANGIKITASAEYQQIEGVLVADAEANGGVKLVALSAPTTPTGVAALKADGKATVYGTEGAVVVNGADGKVMIFDAMGRMVKSVNAEGAATVAMPAGYYIVRTAGTAAKVIVK